MTTPKTNKGNSPLERLRHHVTGAIERGEKTAIVGRPHGMTLSEILERDYVIVKQSSLNLPLPGLIEWFLAEYLDELSPNESTMDKIGQELSKLYP